MNGGNIPGRRTRLDTEIRTRIVRRMDPTKRGPVNVRRPGQPNAQVFFDIWTEAVGAVGGARTYPSLATSNRMVTLINIAKRHGPAASAHAGLYYDRLRNDTACGMCSL